MSCGFKKIKELTWESTWHWTRLKDAEKFAKMISKRHTDVNITCLHKIDSTIRLILTFNDIADEAEFIIKESM
jgi:hypothetical protein